MSKELLKMKNKLAALKQEILTQSLLSSSMKRSQSTYAGMKNTVDEFEDVIKRIETKMKEKNA